MKRFPYAIETDNATKQACMHCATIKQWTKGIPPDKSLCYSKQKAVDLRCKKLEEKQTKKTQLPST